MKKFAQTSVIAGLLALSAQAYADDEYQQFLQEQNKGFQEEQEAFAQYKADVTKEYDDYVAEQERLFKEYTGQIEAKWGAKNVVTSTTKQYVSYDANYSSRSSVDFENGTAKVEVLVTEEEAKNPKVVEQKLKERVAQLAVAKGGTDPLEKKNAIPPEKKPILSAQLATKDGQPVTEKNAQRYAEQAVQPAQITRQTVNSQDGVKRVAVGVQVSLVSNHIKLRATEFRDNLKKDSDRFGIDIALALAITHTESSFNPKAKSSVAYGLMQLVPKSGARDAYLYVYKKDQMVTGDYLFVPNNNIELGTALLSKLMKVDFRGVEDMNSRLYCAISAYNTGPGNVARAFTGKYNVKNALPQINAMTSDQVLEHLKQNLPYEETRTYVAKVSDRMSQWAKQ